MIPITMRQKIGCFVPQWVSWARAVVVASLLGALVGLPGTMGASAKGKVAAESDLFNGTNIVKISITIPEQGMQMLRRTGWGPGNQDDRPEVRATISEGNR